MLGLATLGWVAADEARAQACDRAGSSGVVINEFFSDPPSTDDGAEWLELVNTSSGTVDLSGWVIAAGTSTFGESEPFPAGTELRGGRYLVIGQPPPKGGSPLAEADFLLDGWSLGNASSDADGLQLRDCQGGVADTVIYGGPDDDGWVGDRGDLTYAPVDSGASTGRIPDGRDTDVCEDDFEVLPFATPGTANDGPPQTCGGAESGFVVNEIYPDPDGSDTGFEWVELLHAGSQPIDLAGWSLAMGTSSLAAKHTWKSGTLRPGDRILVGAAYVTDADIVVDSLSLGNASSSSDIVAILDCKGFPADTLVYGEPNDDGFVDDTGRVATRLAPVAGSASALQRAIDGRDTDDNAVDWVVTTEPSPGAPNPRVEPVKCEPSTGGVVINELVPDPDGADEGYEWVELHNPGSSAVSVAGWALSFGTSDFDSKQVVFPGGTELAAGAYFVVGGEAVEAADLVAAFSIGNGTETDGARLFDCEGSTVDTVLYGDAPNLDNMPDDAGDVVDPYADPGSNDAVARAEDGVDTDSAADWKIVGLPTPGESNVRDLGDLEDPLADAPGTGCGRKDPPDAGTGPQPSDPDGGCSTAPGASPLVAPLLVALLRRRRAR
jgi:hypothetical protein